MLIVVVYLPRRVFVATPNAGSPERKVGLITWYLEKVSIVMAMGTSSI